jgi:FkbM family methyltransferase
MPSLKSNAQRVLKQVHLYERVKASCLYDLFWTFADKSVIEQKDSELQFYKTVLTGFRKGDLVFDIGANQGFKTEIFLRLGARVVAVDPDKVNRAILEEKFLKYRLNKKPVVVVGKAVSDKNGSEIFWVDEPGSGKNTLNHKWVEILQNDRDRFGKKLSFGEKLPVVTVTLEELISIYGSPFFVKIDVEGHEFNVLQGLQRPVPYLSFEVNLPEFRVEGLKCVELLERLAPLGQFNYAAADGLKLASNYWLNPPEFIAMFDHCTESSVEVFWKAPNNSTRPTE